MDKMQTNRLLEMLVWLVENPADRAALAGEDPLSARDVLTIMEKLEGKGYYEFLLILLLRAQVDYTVERAMAVYLAGQIKEVLEQGSIQQELSTFKIILQTEMAKKESA